MLSRDYGHVWHFLRTFNLSYCSLYDEGYTSLGKRSQTFPNPALLRKNPIRSGLITPVVPGSSTGSKGNSGQISPNPLQQQEYWPAYMLADWSLERAGRVTSSSSASLKATAATIRAAAASTASVADGVAALASGDECADPLSPDASSVVNATTEGARRTQTAAMLIIGDEILNGFTSESNLQVASQTLSSIGIPLKKVSIVSDDISEIVEEVRRLSQRYDIVITSGGIGPTHDDVTLKAIAQALRQEIRVSTEMLLHLETVQAEQHLELQKRQLQQGEPVSSVVPPLDESMKRLANLPEQSKLRFPPPPDDYSYPVAQSSTATNDDNKSTVVRSKTWPILQCDNIFVLPGVPQFFATKMQLLTKHFLQKHQVMEVRKIILDVEERTLVSQLDGFVSRFPLVKVGSYPFVDHPEFKTIITVEASSIEAVETAVQGLVETLPRHAVLRVERGTSYGDQT